MKNLFTLLTLLIFQQLVWAGVSSSGGGYAVVCRNQNNQIISAELLDLYEAKTRYGFDVVKSSRSAIKDYSDSVDRTYGLQLGATEKILNCPNCITASENFQNFMKIVSWKDSYLSLENQNDLGDISSVLNSISIGCDVNQLAVFNDIAGIVEIAKDIWINLDSLSQAALIQHELYYREARHLYLFPEVSSENTRLNVALIFSNNIQNTKLSIPHDAHFKSIKHNLNAYQSGPASSTDFYTFRVSQNSENEVYRKQFTFIAGRAVLSTTYVDMPSRVNFGDRFYLNGIQFAGWYVEVLPEQDMNTNDWVTVRLFNKAGLAVTDLQ